MSGSRESFYGYLENIVCVICRFLPEMNQDFKTNCYSPPQTNSLCRPPPQKKKKKFKIHIEIQLEHAVTSSDDRAFFPLQQSQGGRTEFNTTPFPLQQSQGRDDNILSTPTVTRTRRQHPSHSNSHKDEKTTSFPLQQSQGREENIPSTPTVTRTRRQDNTPSTKQSQGRQAIHPFHPNTHTDENTTSPPPNSHKDGVPCTPPST